jgi:hypothetical protein
MGNVTTCELLQHPQKPLYTGDIIPGEARKVPRASC